MTKLDFCGLIIAACTEQYKDLYLRSTSPMLETGAICGYCVHISPSHRFLV